jgi:two-component system NtrC family sensor kinase
MPRATQATSRPWGLAAETIAVKVRWFGVMIGIVMVEMRADLLESVRPGSPAALRAILALGALYAALDTYYSLRGRMFLSDVPLVVSLLEAVFIGLLCHFDLGIESPFRFYYMMSLVSFAIRYDRASTYLTCLLHSTSYAMLALEWPWLVRRGEWTFPLTIIVMFWVTWAGSALAELLKRAQGDLERLNSALQENQGRLEERIADRTRELEEAQASVLHQEKMAAFGLLAAGIAHEVGNPLASISSLVQMLSRHHTDAYTQDRLGLVEGQLTRIQGTLRELVDFSRPATRVMTQTHLNRVLDEALSIAKYYKRTKSKAIETDYAAELPPILAVHDQLVQVFLNLILNAIDATGKNGRIRLVTRFEEAEIVAEVSDNGHGIAPAEQPRIFQPYYTTKANGTGLGLFVSRKIVNDLGGTIEFESESGAATTFVVRLPVASEASPKPKPQPRAAWPNDLRGVVRGRPSFQRPVMDRACPTSSCEPSSMSHQTRRLALHRDGRRFQFGVRSLVAATAIVAAILGTYRFAGMAQQPQYPRSAR